MVVRYPVHRRRRDVCHPLYPITLGRFEYVACTLDVRGVDILGHVERQGGRGVYDEVHALHRPVQEYFVADVALDGLDLVSLRVVELLYVKRGDRVPLSHEVTDQVYPQKPGSARDENFRSLHRSGVSYLDVKLRERAS
jgi:hypothetical protein